MSKNHSVSRSMSILTTVVKTIVRPKLKAGYGETTLKFNVGRKTATYAEHLPQKEVLNTLCKWCAVRHIPIAYRVKVASYIIKSVPIREPTNTRKSPPYQQYED